MLAFKNSEITGSAFTILNTYDSISQESGELLPFNYKTSGNRLIITASDQLQTVELLQRFKIISQEMANKLSPPATPRAKVL